MSITVASTDNPRDWPEDFDAENGKLSHICFTCSKGFDGRKGRVICKVCAKRAGVVA